MTDTTRLDSTHVSAECRKCHKVLVVEMTAAQEERWRGGELIQRVLTEPAQRELLISGYCDQCFDELFAGEPEYA